ncbi:uncharacterized protein LOC110426404 [Herrania umbratica]|uniref:Uncharacterized protein LOC110426404 n=1 Tax=Herrania umbratica TaxID=108875 RepID=A0A6J1BCQ7_9ROSI|nr:uncharacterized protein LOC110426404 [Herrania umbratica]
MSFAPIEVDLEEYIQSNVAVEEDSICAIDPIDIWNNWRMELANQMFNKRNAFKEDYLIKLENVLATKLPNANLNAKPHIESRINTLKKEWVIIYDIRNSFPSFNELSDICARDRATGKDAQTIIDILEEKQECNDTINEETEVQELDRILSQVKGLTMMEMVITSIKLSKSPTFMFVFFSVAPDRSLEWLRTFLVDH